MRICVRSSPGRSWRQIEADNSGVSPVLEAHSSECIQHLHLHAPRECVWVQPMPFKGASAALMRQCQGQVPNLHAFVSNLYPAIFHERGHPVCNEC